MKKDVGVYQLDNGNWGFRLVVNIDGIKKNYRKTTDLFGNKLTTKRKAIKAREALLIEVNTTPPTNKPIIRKTFGEVFEEYCANGRNDKAYTTTKKQDSLWRNHLKDRYSKRMVDEFSVAEINDYLSELYYIEGRAFSYVESFLKMFYLIFGQAYSRNYLDVDTYNKLCINKDTKIRMPKRKIDDEDDVVVFSNEEMAALDKYFVGTTLETAYMLGKYCGLRINECFGLLWKDVNLDEGTIRIARQMQYQEGVIKLTSVKTRNGKRTIYMAEPLKEYLSMYRKKLM